jgi:hypothetical protein
MWHTNSTVLLRSDRCSGETWCFHHQGSLHSDYGTFHSSNKQFSYEVLTKCEQMSHTVMADTAHTLHLQGLIVIVVVVIIIIIMS